jgi:hypothetical protein
MGGIVKIVTTWVAETANYLTMATWRGLLDDRGVVHLGPDLACGAQGLECGGDNLRSARPVLVLLTLGLEQLRVREDDPEFVVQAVEQLAQVPVVILVNVF